MCEVASLPAPSSPSTLVYRGAGRLGARMTSYSVLLVLQLQHGVRVVVDRDTLDMLHTYFTLDPGPLPALEDVYCGGEVERLVEMGVPAWREEEVLGLLTGYVVLAFPTTERQPSPDSFNTLWFPDRQELVAWEWK